ncbi:MAG: GAF domain-containing protein [Calditrichaeota bacterium]|nr:GAF domain-containing protein [Calditrichota bacterium]
MSLTAEILAQPTFDTAIRTAVAGVKALKPTYDWVGVYLLEGDVLTLQDDHYLGQPTVHTCIPLGSGICGASATDGETLVIDDVHEDSRYIACCLSVRSEIVVPIMAGERVVGVLDLDSDTPAAFGEADRQELERVAVALARAWQALAGKQPVHGSIP